jgi:galactose-1-phosphate uridylyltransferase
VVKTPAKKSKKPDVKPAKPAAEQPTAQAAQPDAAPQSEPQPAAKVVDMSKENVQQAIAKGQALLKEGKSKADAARAIFELIHDEPRDVVIEAFIQGATITPKGAPTYFYNVSRKFKKAKTEMKDPAQ